MKTTNIFLILAFFSISFFSCNIIEKEVASEPEPTSLQVGLLTYLPFEGNSDDLGETGLNGTITGATITADRKGMPTGAFYFDGENDYILYDQVEKLNFSGAKPYTLSAWIKVEDLNQAAASIFMSKFDGGVGASWYLGVTSDSSVISYRNISPWSSQGISNIPINEFVHLSATYDGTDLKLYVNGVLDSSKAFRGNPSDARTPVMIGGRHNKGVPVPSFRGSVDEIRIYSRVLEKEELEWLSKN